jgi:hypothetical protein
MIAHITNMTYYCGVSARKLHVKFGDTANAQETERLAAVIGHCKQDKAQIAPDTDHRTTCCPRRGHGPCRRNSCELRTNAVAPLRRLAMDIERARRNAAMIRAPFPADASGCMVLRMKQLSWRDHFLHASGLANMSPIPTLRQGWWRWRRQSIRTSKAAWIR